MESNQDLRHSRVKKKVYAKPKGVIVIITNYFYNRTNPEIAEKNTYMYHSKMSMTLD